MQCSLHISLENITLQVIQATIERYTALYNCIISMQVICGLSYCTFLALTAVKSTLIWNKAHLVVQCFGSSGYSTQTFYGKVYTSCSVWNGIIKFIYRIQVTSLHTCCIPASSVFSSCLFPDLICGGILILLIISFRPVCPVQIRKIQLRLSRATVIFIAPLSFWK